MLYVNQIVIKFYLSHRSLDVSDDGTIGIIQKLYANLGDVSGTSSSSKNFVDFGKLNRLIL